MAMEKKLSKNNARMKIDMVEEELDRPLMWKGSRKYQGANYFV